MPEAPRRQGKTPHRQVRVEDDLWERCGQATEALGTDRSGWLRDAIKWCVHAKGVRAPKRPTAVPAESDTNT